MTTDRQPNWLTNMSPLSSGSESRGWRLTEEERIAGEKRRRIETIKEAARLERDALIEVWEE